LQNLNALEAHQKGLEQQVKKLLKLAGEFELVEELSGDLVEQTIEKILIFEDKHIEVEFSFKNEFPLIDRICADG
jgi:hypothetical protein